MGFEEYTVSLPKSGDLSAELNVHLDSMERLIMTLVESGVKSLDALERTKLPSEKGSGTTRKKASAPPAKPQKGGKRAILVDVTKATEPVLDRYTIKLTFTTDQAPFQNVMNVLGDFNPKVMPYFMVVRLMRIENEKAEGPLKEDVKNKKNPEGAEPAPPHDLGVKKEQKTGGPVIEVPVAAKPDAVTIMGEEKIKVYMEVDYVRFREADSMTDIGDQPAK